MTTTFTSISQSSIYMAKDTHGVHHTPGSQEGYIKGYISH